jgi:hypothetical protein
VQCAATRVDAEYAGELIDVVPKGAIIKGRAICDFGFLCITGFLEIYGVEADAGNGNAAMVLKKIILHEKEFTERERSWST